TSDVRGPKSDARSPAPGLSKSGAVVGWHLISLKPIAISPGQPISERAAHPEQKQKPIKSCEDNSYPQSHHQRNRPGGNDPHYGDADQREKQHCRKQDESIDQTRKHGRRNGERKPGMQGAGLTADAPTPSHARCFWFQADCGPRRRGEQQLSGLLAVVVMEESRNGQQA